MNNEYTINMPEYDKLDVYIHEPYGKNFVHTTAVIGPNVTLGEGNYIGPFCVIGYPAEHKAFWGKDQKGVIIGNNNYFTGHVTIDAGTEKATVIGDNCWLLKHSHVGHDAEIGDDVTISCGAKVGGHAIIHSRSNIGLNACIHQRVRVPEGCMIGMNAAVTKKTELSPFRKYAGVPARDIGTNLTPSQEAFVEALKTNKVEPQEVSDLMYSIRSNDKFQLLGQSKEKTIFVLKDVKGGPVMIYNEEEGKVYTSGLGLLCPDFETLRSIFKLLGYEI